MDLTRYYGAWVTPCAEPVQERVRRAAEILWKCLETTLVGKADFVAACRSGQAQYQELVDYYPGRWKLHPLAKLRADGIRPTE